MRLINNAYFLAQIKGYATAARYLARVADCDAVVGYTFAAIGLACIASDLIRLFNGN